MFIPKTNTSLSKDSMNKTHTSGNSSFFFLPLTLIGRTPQVLCSRTAQIQVQKSSQIDSLVPIHYLYLGHILTYNAGVALQPSPGGQLNTNSYTLEHPKPVEHPAKNQPANQSNLNNPIESHGWIPNTFAQTKLTFIKKLEKKREMG